MLRRAITSLAYWLLWALIALMLLAIVARADDPWVIPDGTQPWLTQAAVEAPGKPVVVLVGAEWCQACKEMRADLNAAKLSYRYLDFDRDAKQMQGLMVPVPRGQGFLPQWIVLVKGNAGWERHAIIGKIDAETARSFAKGYETP